MDIENQHRTEELSAKVNRLKHLTLDLDKDVKSQNSLLGNMGFDFDSTGNLLKGGVNRINGMVNSGKANRKMMFYLIVILVLSFFVLYKLFTRVRG